MGRKVASLEVRLNGLVSPFLRAFGRAERALDNFEKRAQRIGGLGTAIFAGSLATGLAKATMRASDMIETTNLLDVSFKSGAAGVRSWAQTTSQAVGRSAQDLMAMAGAIQAVIKPTMGAKADGMSKKLAELSVDLGSYYNKSDQEAQQSIISGLMGESEPMKKFGVVMTDTAINAYLLKKGVKMSMNQMDEASKVAARYAIILDRTKDASGDAARTLGTSFANQLKFATGQVMDLGAALGERLMPVAMGTIKIFNGLLRVTMALMKNDAFGGFVAAVLVGVTAFGAMAAATPALAAGLNQVVIASSSIVKLMPAMAAALTGIFLPVAAAVATTLPVFAYVALAVGVIYNTWKKFGPMISAVASATWTAVSEKTMALASTLIDLFVEAAEGIRGVFRSILTWIGDQIAAKIHQIGTAMMLAGKLSGSADLQNKGAGVVGMAAGLTGGGFASQLEAGLDAAVQGAKSGIATVGQKASEIFGKAVEFGIGTYEYSKEGWENLIYDSGLEGAIFDLQLLLNPVGSSTQTGLDKMIENLLKSLKKGGDGAKAAKKALDDYKKAMTTMGEWKAKLDRGISEAPGTVGFGGGMSLKQYEEAKALETHRQNVTQIQGKYKEMGRDVQKDYASLVEAAKKAGRPMTTSLDQYMSKVRQLEQMDVAAEMESEAVRTQQVLETRMSEFFAIGNDIAMTMAEGVKAGMAGDAKGMLLAAAKIMATLLTSVVGGPAGIAGGGVLSILGNLAGAFHTGGMITAHGGMNVPRPNRAGETVIRAQTGEGVLSRRGVAMLGGAGAVDRVNSGTQIGLGGVSFSPTMVIQESQIQRRESLKKDMDEVLDRMAVELTNKVMRNLRGNFRGQTT